MTSAALVLVLGAAIAHATWNLFAKRAAGGALFVWLCATSAAFLWAPVAAIVVLLQRPHVGWLEIAFIVGSGLLHTTYFICLQRGYALTDLSLVYPLARGSGPLLATVVAIASLGERPSAIALSGVTLIALGVLALTKVPKNTNAFPGILFALITGAVIASYTLWDKHSVAVLDIPPVFYGWSIDFVRSIVLLPLAASQWHEVSGVWQAYHREVVAVAVLAPLAYILILTALRFASVSYVAPAREISIVFGTFLGTHVLAERGSRRRLTAAFAIVLGLVALSFG